MSRDFFKMSDGELVEELLKGFPPGAPNDAIGEAVGVSGKTVGRWRRAGLNARMDDRTRPGVLAYLGATVQGQEAADAYRLGLEKARELIERELRVLVSSSGAGQKHASGGSSARTAVTATGKGLGVEDGGATGSSGPAAHPDGDASEVVRLARQDSPDSREEAPGHEGDGSESA